jgi:hypothetical protein
MVEEDTIAELFNDLLEDGDEKRIFQLVLGKKTPKEIVDDLLKNKKKRSK